MRKPTLILALFVTPLSLLALGCEPDGGDAADMIFLGGDVLTLDEDGPVVEAVAVADGRIAYLGDAAGVEPFRGPETVEVNLDGQAVTPSFVDHHSHVYNVGMSLLNRAEDGRLFIDMAGLSPDAVVDSVRRRAGSVPEGDWIRGKAFTLGWPEGYYPTHRPLTEAAPEHPVLLTRSGHIGLLNRAGMEAVDLTASTPEIPGGEIVRDSDGAPTGMLLEHAVEAALPSIPTPSDEDVVRAFRLATERLAAQGVTRVFDAGILTVPAVADMSADLGRLVRLLGEADRAEPLPVQVDLMVPGPSAFQDTVLANYDEWSNVSPNVRITHIKMFSDGTMYCRTAALSHPFLGTEGDHRIFRTAEADLRDRAERALDAGMDVAIHAIGDAGVGRALDVFEGLLAERPDLDPGRLRIEHFTYASRADFERARDLDVVLSVQPHWGSDPNDRTPNPTVPPERNELIEAWWTLSDMGARLASGTDNFGSPTPPLDLFRAAVTKGVRLSDRTGELDDRAAALAFTTALYPPGGGEAARGRLRVGAPADLAVLSGNPLAGDAASLDALTVEATIRDGRVIFDGGGVPGL